MTRLLLTSFACLFLSACATLTPPPAPTLDWAKVRQQVETLTQPAEVEGPLKSRADARTGGDLWNVSFALEQANHANVGKLGDSRDYFLHVIEQAQQLTLPRCTLWLRLRAVDCRKE